MSKTFVSILILAVLLAGCSGGVVGGKSTERPTAGDWKASGVGVMYVFTFTVAENGGSLELAGYPIPCGTGKMTFVMPLKPITLKISNGSFRLKESDVTITGKFTDNTHAEGTWDSSAHKVGTDNCPASSGSWTASPK
jgi:hypothetical protein